MLESPSHVYAGDTSVSSRVPRQALVSEPPAIAGLGGTLDVISTTETVVRFLACLSTASLGLF